MSFKNLIDHTDSWHDSWRTLILNFDHHSWKHFDYYTAGIPKPFCKWCAFPKTGELPQGRLRPFSKDHRWLQNQQQNYGKRCHESISNVNIINVHAIFSNHSAEMSPSSPRSCEWCACMNRNAHGTYRPVSNVSKLKMAKYVEKHSIRK